MIYRVDLKNYLLHMIDYFTLRELTHFNYAVLSAKITVTDKSLNVAKISTLYPDPEAIIEYSELKDQKIFEKHYFEFLDPDEEDLKNMKRGLSYYIYNNIFKIFINPLNLHHDILILCDESENYIVDAFCKYLKKRFKIEVIDLNKLFIDGKLGSIYIDRKEINEISRDIKIACGNEWIRSKEQTSDGRAELISMMTKKDKIKKLKEFNYKPTQQDVDNIDEVLLTVWNEEAEYNGRG